MCGGLQVEVAGRHYDAWQSMQPELDGGQLGCAAGPTGALSRTDSRRCAANHASSAMPQDGGRGPGS